VNAIRTSGPSAPGVAQAAPDAPRAPRAGSAWRAGAGVALLALLVRVAFIFPLWPVTQRYFDLSHGSDGYELVARTLASQGEFRFHAHLAPTMILPPVYPLFLSGLFALTGPDAAVQRSVTQAAQSLLDAGTTLLIFLLAARWYPRPVAVLAALIYALHPGLWVACARYLTEPLFLFLLTLFVWSGTRWLEQGGRWSLVVASLACAGAALCKAAAVPLPLSWAACMPVLALAGQRSWRRATTGLVLCLITTGVASGTWLWRNHHVSGQWVFPTSLGGQALYTATVYAAHPKQEIRRSAHQAAAEMHEIAARHGLRLDPGDSYPRWFYDVRDEARLDELLRGIARERIAADAGAFRAHLVGNLWRFWFGAPSSRAVSMSALTNGPLLALALIGLVLSRGWRHAGLMLWLAVGACLLLAHLGVLAVVRYSLVVLPIVCLLSAIPLGWLWQRLVSPSRLDRGDAMAAAPRSAAGSTSPAFHGAGAARESRPLESSSLRGGTP
jgi:hypothetical protein